MLTLTKEKLRDYINTRESRFSNKNVIRDKENHFIMIKGLLKKHNSSKLLCTLITELQNL